MVAGIIGYGRQLVTWERLCQSRLLTRRAYAMCEVRTSRWRRQLDGMYRQRFTEIPRFLRETYLMSGSLPSRRDPMEATRNHESSDY